jgi:hemerythrin superfamily protein
MSNPIEQVAAKAMGTVKAVQAGFNGLRGVFLHLAEEHGEVGALMKSLSKSTDAQFRREHFPHIRAELLAHEKGELSEVYPVLANYQSMRDVVLKHNDQAHTLEKAIADVDAQDFAGAEWGSAFTRLLGLVQLHVEEEEKEFFPRAQQVVDEDESKALLKRYEAAKQAVKARL